LTYQDNNDTQIMNYLASSFFASDFEFDAAGNVVSGAFTTKFAAATALVDVSQSVDAKWGIEDDEKERAWKITLRNDLEWENGDPIKAGDFVYSMKQQLDPAYMNYRESSYTSGATALVGANGYIKQGKSGFFAADTIFSEYTTDIDDKLVFSIGWWGEKGVLSGLAQWVGAEEGDTSQAVMEYIQSVTPYFPDVDAAVIGQMEGKTLAQIKADPIMNQEWEDAIGFWKTEPNEEFDFFVTEYSYPAMDFSEVGIWAEGDLDIVIVLEAPIDLLKPDGSLSYKASYYMSGLPLVHEATYEANRKAPAGSDLWTSTYNSSKETTMSWGPYVLSDFQAGKSYTLTRNDDWFGFKPGALYEGQYQTTSIVCETISEYNTALLKFLAGEIEDISIDVSIAPDYKGSQQALFTPSDGVYSIHLQSNGPALAASEAEEAGVDREILTYRDFRQALSLAIDRAAYCTQVTTANMPNLGLYGPLHYYDVANGKKFRDTDVARRSVLIAYGATEDNGVWTVGENTYNDIVAAYDAVTGYNLTLARELVIKSYNEALAAGKISATDTVKLRYSQSNRADAMVRRYNFVNDAWAELMKGTPLEGRFILEEVETGSAWATDFMDAKCEVVFGGWTGGAWSPGTFISAYINPDEAFTADGWDTTAVNLTLTVPGYNNNQPITMNLMDWYYCLNSTISKVSAANRQYCVWGSADEETIRLPIIAALEQLVLEEHYVNPVYGGYSAALHSYKFDYITDEYNTFMAFGGLRYLTYNYDDAEWAEFVKENAVNGELNYKI
jgi:oligopeptide transport system substrate-binding protein